MSGHGGFTVGVTIQMVDRFSAQLKGISSGVLSAAVGVDKLKGKLKGVHEQIMKWQMLGSVGNQMMGVADGFFSPVIKQGNDYVRVLNQMNMQGLKHSEIAKNIHEAWSLSARMPMTAPTENLQALLELKNFFIDQKMEMSEARELLPDFMKAKTLLTASAEHMGFDAGGQVYAMAKALEMRGAANDPAQFKREIEMMSQTMVASSGKVLPSDYQMINKYARIGKIGFDADFLYKHLPELIMENKTAGGGGANTVGTQLQALLRMGIQGVMNVPTATNLQKIGMLPHAVMKTSTTGTVIKEKGSVLGADVLAANPFKWVNEILIPHMEKARGRKFDNDKELKQEVAKTLNMAISTTIKGAGTTVGLISELANKKAQIERFAMVMKNLKNTDLLMDMAKNDPAVAQVAFAKSLEKLNTAFGENVVPLLVPRIMWLAETISKVGNYLHQNKDSANWIVSFVAGIGLVGAALAGISTVILPYLILTAAGVAIAFWPAALAIAGVTLAVGGLVMAFLNWGRVSAQFQRWANQAQASSIRAQIMFRNLMGLIVSSIAWVVVQVSSYLAKLTNGVIKFDTSGMLATVARSNAAIAAENLKADIQASRLEMAGGKYVDLNAKTKAPTIGKEAARPVNVHSIMNFKANLTVNESKDGKLGANTMKGILNEWGKEIANGQTLAGGSYTSPHHAGGR